MERSEAIRRIKAGLEWRSGKRWSVTGGHGTAWGWLTIDAPPSRRTWDNRLKSGGKSGYPEDYEEADTGEPGHFMSPGDREELGRLLGNGGPVHFQGRQVPASDDHWREYIDRAEGRTPAKVAEAYWD